MDGASLKIGQKSAGRKAGIDAHGGNLLQAGLGAVYHVKDDVQRTLGSADIAGAQAGVQHVASFSDRGNKRVLNPGAIMAVPLRFRLVAIDLDWQTVHI